ncbi:hypothetical protein V6N13_013427 [Hibiscus sabdariffa]|uniref:Uncharacterized protein n=2 Tax=Hibiscus sabdariffa TaxID=183260 RepID=A0ABR2P1X0_9ROSI
MEPSNKLAFALATIAVVLAATMPRTATAARNEAMVLAAENNPTGASVNSTSINTKNDALAIAFDADLHHKRGKKCIPRSKWCVFQGEFCCGKCLCFGVCMLC